MKVRFLLDENLSPRLKPALLRLESTIDVLRVGDPDAPPMWTTDYRNILNDQKAFAFAIAAGNSANSSTFLTTNVTNHICHLSCVKSCRLV